MNIYTYLYAYIFFKKNFVLTNYSWHTIRCQPLSVIVYVDKDKT